MHIRTSISIYPTPNIQMPNALFGRQVKYDHASTKYVIVEYATLTLVFLLLQACWVRAAMVGGGVHGTRPDVAFKNPLRGVLRLLGLLWRHQMSIIIYPKQRNRVNIVFKYVYIHIYMYIWAYIYIYIMFAYLLTWQSPSLSHLQRDCNNPTPNVGVFGSNTNFLD